MADKRYELNTLEEICRDLDAELPSVEQYFEHHDLRADGLWVRLLKRRAWPQLSRHEFAWLEWHPLGNLELPALPIPFTARQLTAFALGGRAGFILDVGTARAVRFEDETDAAFQRRFGLTADEATAVCAMPNPPELLESNSLMALGANADKAREVLREVHQLYAECVERFGVSDEGVREAAEWLCEVAPLAEEASQAKPPARSGPAALSTRNIALNFDGLRWTESQWKKPLGDKPKWLRNCIVLAGKRGERETLWDPVLIGAALVKARHVPANRVRARFQTKPLLTPWLEAWKAHEAEYIDTN
jgi:hypothetical protein